MNSLRIKFIASSMVIILSAGQAFGMGTQSTLPSATTVVVTPDLNGQGVTGVNVVENSYTGIFDKQRFSDVVNYSKDKLHNVKNKAFDLCSTTGQRAMDIVSNAKAHPYKTAGYTLAAGATTAAVIYGVYKSKKNVKSKNAKLSMLIQQAAENGNFVAANTLINELIIPETQKDDIRNKINNAIQNKILGKITNMPVVRNTHVVEPVKTVVKSAVENTKNAVTELKEATKNAVNSVSSSFRNVTSSVQKALNDLSTNISYEFDNGKRKANKDKVALEVASLEIADTVKAKVKAAYNKVIYADTKQALKNAQEELTQLIKSL